MSEIIRYDNGYYSLGHILSMIPNHPSIPFITNGETYAEKWLPDHIDRLREIASKNDIPVDDLIRPAREQDCGSGQFLLECHPDVLELIRKLFGPTRG